MLGGYGGGNCGGVAMKALIPKRFVRTRAFFDEHGGLLSFLLIIIVAIAGFAKQTDLANHTNDIANQNKHAIARISTLTTELCKVATALELYQPNLDPRVVDILVGVANEFPIKCFPDIPEPRGGR
jgi:hypothetical protein